MIIFVGVGGSDNLWKTRTHNLNKTELPQHIQRTEGLCNWLSLWYWVPWVNNLSMAVRSSCKRQLVGLSRSLSLSLSLANFLSNSLKLFIHLSRHVMTSSWPQDSPKVRWGQAESTCVRLLYQTQYHLALHCNTIKSSRKWAIFCRRWFHICFSGSNKQ